MDEHIKKQEDAKARRWERLGAEIQAKQRARKTLGIALGVLSLAGALLALALR